MKRNFLLSLLVFLTPSIVLASPVNPFLYQSRPLDSGTTLYDLRARSLDPSTGSFISPDPLGLTNVGENLNSYPTDPINFSDPLGLAKQKGRPKRRVTSTPADALAKRFPPITFIEMARLVAGAEADSWNKMKQPFLSQSAGALASALYEAPPEAAQTNTKTTEPTPAQSSTKPDPIPYFPILDPGSYKSPNPPPTLADWKIVPPNRGQQLVNKVMAGVVDTGKTIAATPAAIASNKTVQYVWSGHAFGDWYQGCCDRMTALLIGPQNEEQAAWVSGIPEQYMMGSLGEGVGGGNFFRGFSNKITLEEYGLTRGSSLFRFQPVKYLRNIEGTTGYVFANPEPVGTDVADLLGRKTTADVLGPGLRFYDRFGSAHLYGTTEGAFEFVKNPTGNAIIEVRLGDILDAGGKFYKDWDALDTFFVQKYGGGAFFVKLPKDVGIYAKITTLSPR